MVVCFAVGLIWSFLIVWLFAIFSFGSFFAIFGFSLLFSRIGLDFGGSFLNISWSFATIGIDGFFGSLAISTSIVALSKVFNGAVDDFTDTSFVADMLATIFRIGFFGCFGSFAGFSCIMMLFWLVG